MTPEPSPAPEAPAVEPTAEPEPKAEPTAEEAAAAARASVPEAAEGYAVNLTDDQKTALGLTDGDPLVQGLRDYAKAQGKPQGWMDDALEAAAALGAAGLFEAALDPAAEATALGENAEGRRREVEVFATALKGREGFDDGMFGELMSLSPTANGVRLVEWFRKQMGAGGDIPVPSGETADPKAEIQAEARQLAADERYGRDRAFTVQADKKWMEAFR